MDHRLQVDDLHSLHIETHGLQVDGPPCLFLHGGPGHWFVFDRHSKLFDLTKSRLISFDQRGCGKSTPRGELRRNTPSLAVEDIASVLNFLEIPRAVLVGGSWGATLALLFALKHPSRCHGLALRGPWLWDDASIQWIWGGWAGQIFPTEWATFGWDLPPNATANERISAYRSRLSSITGELSRNAALRWLNWEERLCCYKDRPNYLRAISDVTDAHVAMARMEAGFVLDHQSVGDMIRKGPEAVGSAPVCKIVQGRYDFLCPPSGALSLQLAWPGSTVQIVSGGHKADHEPIKTAMRQAIADCQRIS